MPYAAAATSGLTNVGKAPVVAKGLGPAKSPPFKPFAAGGAVIRFAGTAPNPNSSGENPLAACGPGIPATVVPVCGNCGELKPAVMPVRLLAEIGPGATGHPNPGVGDPVHIGAADPKSNSFIDFSFNVAAFVGCGLRPIADRPQTFAGVAVYITGPDGPANGLTVEAENGIPPLSANGDPNACGCNCWIC